MMGFWTIKIKHRDTKLAELAKVLREQKAATDQFREALRSSRARANPAEKFPPLLRITR